MTMANTYTQQIKHDWQIRPFTIHEHYKEVAKVRQSLLPLQLCQMIWNRKQFLKQITK